MIDISSVVLREQPDDASVSFKCRQVEGISVVIAPDFVHINVLTLQKDSDHFFLGG